MTLGAVQEFPGGTPFRWVCSSPWISVGGVVEMGALGLAGMAKPSVGGASGRLGSLGGEAFADWPTRTSARSVSTGGDGPPGWSPGVPWAISWASFPGAVNGSGVGDIAATPDPHPTSEIGSTHPDPFLRVSKRMFERTGRDGLRRNAGGERRPEPFCQVLSGDGGSSWSGRPVREGPFFQSGCPGPISAL